MLKIYILCITSYVFRHFCTTNLKRKTFVFQTVLKNSNRENEILDKISYSLKGACLRYFSMPVDFLSNRELNTYYKCWF